MERILLELWEQFLIVRVPRADFPYYLLCGVVLSAISLDISFGMEGFKLGNVILLAMSLLVIWLRVVNSKGVFYSSFSKFDIPFLSFLTIALVSAYWSPGKVETVFHVALLSCMYVSIMVLGSVDASRVIGFVVRAGVFFCLLSLLLLVVYPSGALQPISSSTFPELRGVFDHQLRLGLFAGVVWGFMIISYFNGDSARVYRHKGFFSLGFIIVTLTLVLAAARLYTFFVFLSLAAVVFSLLFFRYGRVFLLVGFFGVILLVVYSEVIFDLMDSYGLDATLTGRTIIWDKSIQLASERPIWGFGFPSFNSIEFDSEWQWYRPAHPHNSFIQVLFELGCVGTGVVMFWVASNFLEGVYRFKVSRYAPYFMFVFFVTLLGSLTGANYASKPSFLIVLLFVVISVVRHDKSALNHA